MSDEQRYPLELEWEILDFSLYNWLFSNCGFAVKVTDGEILRIKHWLNDDISHTIDQILVKKGIAVNLVCSICIYKEYKGA